MQPKVPQDRGFTDWVDQDRVEEVLIIVMVPVGIIIANNGKGKPVVDVAKDEEQVLQIVSYEILHVDVRCCIDFQEV